MKYISVFKHVFLLFILTVSVVLFFISLVSFIIQLVGEQHIKSLIVTSFILVISFFCAGWINRKLENITILKNNDVAFKIEGENYSFLRYKDDYSVEGAERILYPETFDEAKEEKIELNTKTKDGKNYNLGISLIKYHVKEKTEQELHRYFRRYIKTKETLEVIDINRDFKENVENKLRSISLSEIERDLVKILRQEADKLEEKCPFYIKVHAYYY